jgi:hypothetical protein
MRRRDGPEHDPIDGTFTQETSRFGRAIAVQCFRDSPSVARILFESGRLGFDGASVFSCARIAALLACLAHRAGPNGGRDDDLCLGAERDPSEPWRGAITTRSSNLR